MKSFLASALRRRSLQSAFAVGQLRLSCGLRSLLVLHQDIKDLVRDSSTKVLITGFNGDDLRRVGK